jgi:hypothetical protein
VFGWIGGGGTSAAKQERQCKNRCHYEIRFHVQDYLTASTGLAHEKCANACGYRPVLTAAQDNSSPFPLALSIEPGQIDLLNANERR